MNDDVYFCYVVFSQWLEFKFDVVSIYLLEGLWRLGELWDVWDF